jgi:hypothetical protein
MLLMKAMHVAWQTGSPAVPLKAFFQGINAIINVLPFMEVDEDTIVKRTPGAL